MTPIPPADPFEELFDFLPLVPVRGTGPHWITRPRPPGGRSALVVIAVFTISSLVGFVVVFALTRVFA